MWLLHWNEAIGWVVMELVRGLLDADCALEKGRAGEMELGQEIA